MRAIVRRINDGSIALVLAAVYIVAVGVSRFILAIAQLFAGQRRSQTISTYWVPAQDANRDDLRSSY